MRGKTEGFRIVPIFGNFKMILVDLRIRAEQVESRCELTFNSLFSKSKEQVTSLPFTKVPQNLDF